MSYTNSTAVRKLLVLLSLFAARTLLGQDTLVLDDNMKVLNAQLPNTTYRFVGSNAPGQMFLPNERATLNLEFTKGSDTGVVKEFGIEIQEITTRDPGARVTGKVGSTDTTGNAALIGLEGEPVEVPITVNFTDKNRLDFQVEDFPVPSKFGTYALVLTRGTARQFLATVARVPQPRPYGTIDNTPIFGEAALLDPQGKRMDYFTRMGIHGFRREGTWSEKPDGTVDWTKYDVVFKAAQDAGCRIMITLGGDPEWTRPFLVPTPAARWNPRSQGYNGTGDWVCKPELYPRYGKWIEAFVSRYDKDGKGPLWGLENYNEPWEGGGISGWARDCLQYRALQKLIATSAKKVTPDIKILAASAIMNTEDKLFSDGSRDMDPYIDIFTDHYVPPANSYGPMVARAHGKESMESESWFAGSEVSLPQGLVQSLACGQLRVVPWHPRVVFDTVTGSPDKYLIPTPLAEATAAFNYMVTGRRFEKMPFTDRLPLAFQFGADQDKDGVILLVGRLIPMASPNVKTLLWPQVNGTDGGTITIDNSDGLLEFYDIAANREFQSSKTVTVPLGVIPTYIKSAQGPAAVAGRLNSARIDGRRFIEIVPKDFDTLPNAPGAAVRVELRNRLNREVNGTLKVTVPDGLVLKGENPQAVTLKAGESKTLEFAVASVVLSAANSYPFSFAFSSDAGSAGYAEALNAAVVPYGTKTVDGNLDDWKNVPGVTVFGSREKEDNSELLRRPWLEIQQGKPDATSGEFKMAWDKDYLYICATVNDPTTETAAFRFADRDENSYFHSAASDNISPYKEFIEGFRQKTGNPARSFAEVPYVYRRSPEEGTPYRRDRLQFGFDVTPGLHDLQEPTEVAAGFHAEPDTDYEYSLYWVNDGNNGNSELWRLLAPGVPRIHDWPHQLKGARTTGLVPGAKSVVKREGNIYIYEAAIPRSELADLKLEEGASFGFALTVGNSKGVNAIYGDDKAVTKRNALTLHPYWQNGPSAGTRWTLTK